MGHLEFNTKIRSFHCRASVEPRENHVHGNDEVAAHVAVADLDVLNLGRLPGQGACSFVSHRFNAHELQNRRKPLGEISFDALLQQRKKSLARLQPVLETVCFKYFSLPHGPAVG